MADQSQKSSFYNGYNDNRSSTTGPPVSSNTSSMSQGLAGAGCRVDTPVQGTSAGHASLMGQQDVRRSDADRGHQACGGATADGADCFGEKRYDTGLGINVRIYSGDISKSEADAITTGEGLQVILMSQVTRSIAHLLGTPFEERREKLFTTNGGHLKGGEVYVTNIKSDLVKYQYVLHTVVLVNRGSISDVRRLYCKVLERSDLLKVDTVAVPLLGTGSGQIGQEDAIRALADGLHRYAIDRLKRYTKPLNVEIVTPQVKLIDIVYKEIEKCFNSQPAPASTQNSGTLMSKTSSKKHLQGSAEHTTHRASGHKCSDRSYTWNKGPQLRSNRLTTVSNGAMVAAFDTEKAGTGAIHGLYHEPGMTNLQTRTADLSLGCDVPSRKPHGHSSGNDAGDTPHLGTSSGWGGQCNETSSSGGDQDGLEETDRVIPEEQPDLKVTDVGRAEEETCPICMDLIQNMKVLGKCGHKFCQKCIEDCFRSCKPICPTCLTVYDVITGNMPQGTMSVNTASFPSLPGYEGCGFLTIQYHFPDGWQTHNHPHPGRRYHGTSRVAFLPANGEGRKVCRLLQLAFDRKLTFTVGRSATTGRDDVVTWNDIHHKTNVDGGPTRFGYPDDTYLFRVQEELASKGVTEDQL
ncbi:uncharacterized protein LOC124139724 [Haliotis rufescens]|uniref:uncharacterized protein LOC124139724 n=1 Tax=Haliotis rufescens TaxID=6454 RepID=UPI00201F982E|nr:uncharacterized protein LOC124139724 [Haliotis rufescens]XP_046362975.2 uncharacterized protein LOC124139724 [Haliotis rufescens]